MDVNEALEILRRTDGIEADRVQLAIHDGLQDINQLTLSNRQKMDILNDLFMSLTTQLNGTDATAEVILARGTFPSLNARLHNIVTRLGVVETKADENPLHYETKTRTVVVPYETTYENDSTKYPHESYVRVQGTNGSQTITYEEEFINGVSTGRVVNERVTATTPPVNRVEVRGTKVLNARPIRYIRINTRVQGTTQGQIAELEIWANNQNIANRATVTLPSGTTQSNQALMFDGQRNTNANIISGNNSFIQLDLGQGYSNISRINLLLRAGLTYNVVRLEVSVDGKTWTRVYNNNQYVAPNNFNGLDFADYIIYGDGSTFVDDGLTRQDVPIGGIIKLSRPNNTPIYTDSGRAAAKVGALTYSGGHSTLTVTNVGYVVRTQPTGGHYIIINSGLWVVFSPKPTGDYDIIYGTNAGWFREDDL